MFKKYLYNNPIESLANTENPAICYIVKKEFYEQSDYQEIYNDLLNSKLTEYFKKNCRNLFLGDINRPDLLYKGSIWFFLYAVECGYNLSTDFICSTSEIISKQNQLSDGGFRFNNSFNESSGCRTGNIVYAMLKSGIRNKSTDNGIKWIIANQRHDGGWLHCPAIGLCNVMKLLLMNKTGNFLKYENSVDIKSCPIASYFCLKAINEYSKDKYKYILMKGSEFLIQNNFFINDTTIKCGNKVNFKKIGYPIMLQYDFLSGLNIVSEISPEYNLKNSFLFNSIIKKQNSDGMWNCENMNPGMINEKKESSKWTTINALRLIKSVIIQENQLEKA